ncbi:hypothetical protein D7V88_21420 [Corallococcus terminator]|uniref:Uncharacterized protein n=2 Tax=Corallococcus terminator TaxID=2316733 RepID=A0A3A8IMR9_9BACT|nr:hypothetical protein D7V88_21420 [Corallococcus terminator]
MLSSKSSQNPQKTRTKAEIDNRATQLDPRQDAYWKSRGMTERPVDDSKPEPPEPSQPLSSK